MPGIKFWTMHSWGVRTIFRTEPGHSIRQRHRVWGEFELANVIERLDEGAVRFVNQPSGESWAVDYLIVEATMLSTVKLLPLLALCLWLWMSPRDTSRVRAGILSGTIGAFFALAMASLFQILGPERPRPMHAEIDGFTLPLVTDPSTLEGWSSFPSDHAALAFSLATGVWLAARGWGLSAMAWAMIVVCLPRIYAGYHYPTDIFGGALVGIVSVLLMHAVMAKRYERLEPAEPRLRAAMYVVGFFVFYQMATLFNDVRSFGSAAKAIADNLV